MIEAVAAHGPRYTEPERREQAAAFARDGFVLLREHFAPAALNPWQAAFSPLLTRHLGRLAADANRGSARHYITLPFAAPFDDPRLYADPDIVALCRLLVGDDMWMCQLGSDTPLLGSTYQDVHRDAPPLFPERSIETPPFQLAVNFPLVDVTSANGPTEIARGTHEQTREIGMDRLQRGEIALESIEMRVGDVLVRDVRGLHRGTPNTTATPRPMIVIGYSRRWLLRPEVQIKIGRTAWAGLNEAQRYLLRFNPVLPDEQAAVEGETYDKFAF